MSDEIHLVCEKCNELKYACRCHDPLPPVRSELLLDVAKRLCEAWSSIDNALTGLATRGEKNSPLVRDLKDAQEEVETARQAIYEKMR